MGDPKGDPPQGVEGGGEVFGQEPSLWLAREGVGKGG